MARAPSAARPPSAPVAVIDPAADPRWRAFVSRAAGATIFHHPAWLGLIHDRYRYPVAACCLLSLDPPIGR
jgi:hypothetical protein